VQLCGSATMIQLRQPTIVHFEPGPFAAVNVTTDLLVGEWSIFMTSDIANTFTKCENCTAFCSEVVAHFMPDLITMTFLTKISLQVTHII